MKGKPAFFMYVSGLILFQSRAGVNYPVSHHTVSADVCKTQDDSTHKTFPTHRKRKNQYTKNTKTVHEKHKTGI